VVRLRAAVLAAVFVAAAAGCFPPPDRDKPKSPEPAAAAVGRIDALDGKAVLIHGDQRIAATAGYPVFAGDRLETGAGGKVQVTLADHSVVAIGSGTTLVVSELLLEGGNRTGRLSVAIGKFWLHVTQWKKGESNYEIATPNAVAGVRGTTLWGDTGVDAICALDGTVEVRSLKAAGLAPATLTTGNCASALSQGKLEPLAPSKETVAGYLAEVLIPSAPR